MKKQGLRQRRKVRSARSICEDGPRPISRRMCASPVGARSHGARSGSGSGLQRNCPSIAVTVEKSRRCAAQGVAAGAESFGGLQRWGSKLMLSRAG